MSYPRQTASIPAYFRPNVQISFHLPYLLPTMLASNSAVCHPLSHIGVPEVDVLRLTVSDMLCKSKKCLSSKLLGIPEGISYHSHLTDDVYMCHVLTILISFTTTSLLSLLSLLSDSFVPYHDDPSCARSINVCHEKLGW